MVLKWIFTSIVRLRHLRRVRDDNDDYDNGNKINSMSTKTIHYKINYNNNSITDSSCRNRIRNNNSNTSNNNNNNNSNNTTKSHYIEKNFNDNDDNDNDNYCSYHDKPPLLILNGLPYFIISNICMQYGHLILFDNNHTIYNGLSVYIGLCILMVLLDGYVSNHLGMNIITLRKYSGYTDSMISCIILYNIITTQMLSWFIFHIICKGLSYDILLSWYATPISMYQYKYIAYVIFAVIINLCITELFFYYGHKLLHEKYPLLHIMHHCCLLPSHSSNVIFHPIDIMIEFGGPALFLLLLHYMIWEQNINIMMLSYTFIQVYYAWDHSEYLKTYHYYHHTNINSVYTVYMNYKSNPILDQIRHHIKNKR